MYLSQIFGRRIDTRCGYTRQSSLDENRDAFLRRNDSLLQVQLNTQNLEAERVIPFEEVVFDKCNDDILVPLQNNSYVSP